MKSFISNVGKMTKYSENVVGTLHPNIKLSQL